MDDLGYFRIAGVSHYQDALSRCAPGEHVKLVHEPDNPHDPMAIRVVSLSGETIGYVPRANWVHRLVHEKGRGVTGVIDSIGMSRACLLGALVSAAICDDRPVVQSYFPDRPAMDEPEGGYRYWVTQPIPAN